MSDKSPLVINIDIKSEDRKCQIIENTVTSILFQVTNTTTRYVYKIHMRGMRNQSETAEGGLKNLDLKKECDLLVKNRTETEQAFALNEKHRGNIMLVEFFKYEGVPVLCATCVLIVKPSALKIAQVIFKDSTGKEVGCGSVQYEADLKFSLRVKYNRPLLRGEKAPKLKSKGYCTNATTGEYEEISKFRIDENATYTDTFYCDNGLQESHAGADYVFSFGINNPYEPPFMIEDTNVPAPSTQKIHLIGRNLKKPQITSVVWSSKEMIKFGEDSPQRKDIYRNEDGFLHIHTRGMYGQKVRIELFEKDTMGSDKKLLLGLKNEITILDNVVCVPVEMSGVYAKADKGRHALAEGLSFEIISKVTPLDTSIAAFEQDDKSMIELKIYGKADEDKAAKSTVNGTMKFVIADVEEDEKEEKKGKDCGGKYCITKSNYKEKNAGKLIQEINIRLAGFGGNVPTEQFDDRTEACIKQFQRDYMGGTATGKICGSLLKAIDEFCENTSYDFSFEQTKCPCTNGKYKAFGGYTLCSGYGNRKNNEHPGMHRSLLFILKALLFYLKKTKSKYTLDCIYSAYRCTTDNNDSKRHTVRKSTNHMGNALDLHFKKDGIRTSSVDDMEAIRKDFFCKYMGAPEGKKNNTYYFGWERNKIGLEPKKFKNGASGATSWVHVDVREFTNYKADDFYIKEKNLLASKTLIQIAKELNLKDMCNCLK